MTTNVFEATLGCDDIAWHAVWRFLHWLCNPDEGHGLGRTFRDALTTFAFGHPLARAGMKREFRFEDPASGGGKWPDLVIAGPDFSKPRYILLMDDLPRGRLGDTRKLTNLNTYMRHAAGCFSGAVIRLLVLSNAPNDAVQVCLQKALGSGISDESQLVGWKVLPLQLTGQWVSTQVAASPVETRPALSDYVAWTGSASREPRAALL